MLSVCETTDSLREENVLSDALRETTSQDPRREMGEGGDEGVSFCGGSGEMSSLCAVGSLLPESEDPLFTGSD